MIEAKRWSHQGHVITSCLQVKGSGNYRDAHLSSVCTAWAKVLKKDLTTAVTGAEMVIRTLRVFFCSWIFGVVPFDSISGIQVMVQSWIYASFPPLINHEPDGFYLLLYCVEGVCRVWFWPHAERPVSTYTRAGGSWLAVVCWAWVCLLYL